MSYEARTQGICVYVDPIFLENQSEPHESRYVWAYQIRIENTSSDTVQLINRYWQITDAMGRVEEVRGPGVVGQQPVLGPGEYFEYTSGAPLKTPSGIMTGTYQMTNQNGVSFDVEIPTFSLDSPHQVVQLN